MLHKVSSPFDHWHRQVRKSVRLPAIFGLVVFCGLAWGFAVWASKAPISSAIVAQGSFAASGTNKLVQHLEGGIVREILVREGDEVVPGQPLVQLDGTAIGAELSRLEMRRLTLRATMVRFDAEQHGGETLVMPRELFGVAVTAGQKSIGIDNAHVVETQIALFNARREQLSTERDILQSRVQAIEEEISGLQAQRASTELQLDLLREELATSEQLAAKGLMRTPQMLQLKRAHAKLSGDIGQLVATIGNARQRVLETKSEIIKLRRKSTQEAVDGYRAAQAEIDDIEQRLPALRDVQQRQTVMAPVRGVVVKLNQNTPGGVLAPGQQILELLPLDERLLVEARIRPSDIDQVYLGLPAELRLTALNQRTTPMVRGKVVFVSADTIEGAQPGERFFVARIELDTAEHGALAKLKITPGMPAEVYILNGDRTLVDYMLKPIRDSIHRSFRES